MIDKPELNWIALAPELITGGGAMLVLLVGMGRSSLSRLLTTWLSLAALAAAITVTLVQFSSSRYGEFAGQLVSDELANVGRLIAAGCGAIAVAMAVRGRPDDGRHGEYHALLLSAVCGMGLMAASASFVTLFVGLELFSIALYVMCALDAERTASLESGLKYLIVGGMSSAVLLYGVALTYGATGSLTFTQVGGFDGNRGMLLFGGAAMVLGGFAFKVSAAPMHWWTPDVYEGASTPVTAFMSTATKAVAFLALARVLTTAYPLEADRWMPAVAGLAVASIVVGNLGALVQPHLKRMLAYSSIAQAGYLLCGIVGWESTGVPALVYALVVYAAMTLGAFAYVLVVERELGRDATFADLAGRGWISEEQSLLRALPALGFTICALSLAGIPPTAGFFSKFGLFDATYEAGYGWLAVVGALGSVISLGFYLRPAVELYMRPADAERVAAETASLPAPSQADNFEPVKVGTKMPVVALIGVGLAVLVMLLAYMPQRVFDAGCDARGELVGGACTQVEAADAKGDAPIDDSAPATAAAADTTAG
ncbi:MAG: proton-translocating NADH-quinone oxidoreductase, chain [Thermoleophilia bacterium]|nr:proton-translocating NADH-quinone oxidoreductase, chain [Thermoleophilia bacterium]